MRKSLSSLLRLFRKFRQTVEHPAGDASQKVLEQLYQQRFFAQAAPPRFRDTGLQIHSQHEEDGLLLYIFSLLGAPHKTCVEMCAGNGIECNTANLILHHRWNGLLFDGDAQNVAAGQEFYARHPATRHWPPTFRREWITRSNINTLITGAGFAGEIGLFSLDVDGVDYWLWEALEAVQPRVVVLEFNHLWGPDRAVTVPYADDFKAEITRYGSDYAGASLAAFVKLARRKNYRLVGTNAIATNAFFVRNDLPHPWLPEISPQECFDHPRARFGREQRWPLIRDKSWQEV